MKTVSAPLMLLQAFTQGGMLTSGQPSTNLKQAAHCILHKNMVGSRHTLTSSSFSLFSRRYRPVLGVTFFLRCGTLYCC